MILFRPYHKLLLIKSFQNLIIPYKCKGGHKLLDDHLCIKYIFKT